MTDETLSSRLRLVLHDLDGAIHDLTHQFDPNDGGVCVKTLRRAEDQIEDAIAALDAQQQRIAALEKALRTIWQAANRAETDLAHLKRCITAQSAILGYSS